MIWRWVRKGVYRSRCLHVWDYHVAALPKIGDPETWKKCRSCGKIEVEHVA